MKRLLLSFVALIILVPSARADIGLNIGMGVPFISQFGIDYTMGTHWTLSASQNSISLKSDEASVDLTMPQVLLNFHPFGGVFYIGVGAGKETLTAEATDSTTGYTAKAEISANTALARVGWMWGKMNSGFWFGMDVTYVSPSGGKVNIDANGVPTTSQEYKDVEKAGEDFGKTAYTSFTFARFGWLF